MIGNDVVDLNLAKSQSNWRRPNYLQKIFTKDEQHYILASDNPDVAVWTLWSRKEAAYKILNRLEGVRKYNPQSYNCCGEGLLLDYIHYYDQKYFTKTFVGDDFVHSVAVENAAHLSKIIEVEKGQVIKKNLLPFYLEYNKLLPASVTHHGKFYFAVAIKS